jgi:hypothetical protein
MTVKKVMDGFLSPQGEKEAKRMKVKPGAGAPGNGKHGQRPAVVVPPNGAHRGVVVPARPACDHRGLVPVAVGPYQIFAGGTRYLQAEDLVGFDLVLPLGEAAPLALGQRAPIVGCPWRDFQPPPAGMGDFLREVLIPALAAGQRVLAFCIGSHGRTGTLIASLIAVLEPSTQDPIAVARARHCTKAVETAEQAKFIFALRGAPCPVQYAPPPPPPVAVQSFGGGAYQRSSDFDWPREWGR